MGPQSRGSPNPKVPSGSPGTKSHLDVALVERCRVYYKGEGSDFPQVQAVVSLVSPSCMWLVLASKVLQLCTNHLVLVLCRSVWVIEACQFFLVPSRSSSMPLYPSKVLWARERAPTPCFSVVFCLGLTFGVPQGVRSMSSMLMTWLSQEIMMQTFLIWRRFWNKSLRWRIWESCITFSALR
jgi:hypothetical protein